MFSFIFTLQESEWVLNWETEKKLLQGYALNCHV